MNNISQTHDWSAIAAWIALAVAILSPLLTSLINNLHQQKMRKLEFALSREADMISEYLEIASREIMVTGVSDSYMKLYAKIFFYAPKNTWAEIEELNTLMIDGKNSNEFFADKDKCMELLIRISKKMNRDFI